MDYKNLFIRSFTSSIFIFLIIYSIFQLDRYLILISSAVYLIIFVEILIFFKKKEYSIYYFNRLLNFFICLLNYIFRLLF